MSSRDFVYSKFYEYYNDPSLVIPAPLHLEQREFAYLQFKERFMVRHKRFETMEGFQSLLRRNVPSDVYHSCAYYENPDFDMDKERLEWRRLGFRHRRRPHPNLMRKNP